VDIWQLSEDEVYAAVGSAPGGLTAEQVRERQAQYGANVLQEKRKRPIIYRFFAQFKDLFALLLIVASVLCFITYIIPPRDIYNLEVTIAIALVVVLNAVMGFFQEFRASKATEALKRMVPSNARVVREGETIILPARELVPGDILILEEGDSISADARLLRQYELTTNQVSLTGESDPVRKTADAVLDEGLTHIDLPNMVFMGTSVASGTGRAILLATGMDTEFGKIFALTTEMKEELSPLQREIGRMAKTVSIIAVSVGIVLFFMGRLLGLGWVEDVLFAIGVMVACVPEGLPATLSVALAIGIQRMARENALIKKLSAVEALGSATVICTDKTGTLTKAEMTVKEIRLPGHPIYVAGAGYEPSGHFEEGGAALEPDAAKQTLELLLRIASFCNNSRLMPPKDDRPWRIIGDPTEGALLTAAQKAGFDLTAELMGRPKIHELPFDSVRKRMTVIHVEGDGQVGLTKGAPKEIIERCSHYVQDGRVLPIDDDCRARFLADNDAMAGQALRVLAMAYRPLPDDMTEYDAETVERDLVYVGLMGMLDPPRPEVSQAVRMCYGAGIRIIMMTGDYGLTAEAIARRIGIVSEDQQCRVITGIMVDAMSDDEFDQELADKSPLILARVAPAHKMRVVTTLKSQGEVVAVTGDGVNDAPALKRADIGVAMGIAGTDVSKEASVMILLDDSFATIVKAVEQGRGVYANLRKMVLYLFSHNCGELFPYVFSTLFGIHLVPLSALQVLAIDLGSDVLPGLALGTEKPEPGIMDRQPRSKKERLLDSGVLRRLVFLGTIQSAGATIAFLHVLLSHGWKWGADIGPGSALYPVYREAITATQAAIVVSQFANGFVCRTERASLARVGVLSNLPLLGAEILGLIIVCAISYVPFLQGIFNTAPLSAVDWGVLWGFAGLLLVAEEGRKALARRNDRRSAQGG
jgi:magnesium-transporting ATPase (P-type)